MPKPRENVLMKVKTPQRARPRILFIGHSYHQVTKSSAFFLKRLERLGEVTTAFDGSVKGTVQPHYLAAAEPYDIVVVWQLPKVIEQFAASEHRGNIVYVPMYDAVHRLDRDFWQSLKHIKIVCFSSTIQAICLTHGLDSFFIQYYPEWIGFSPAGYSAKSLFFWQRRTWPSWQTVASILPTSQFDRMHHHVAIDPGFEIPPERAAGPTPSELRDGRLGSSVWFDDRKQLFEKLREFNVFFLPREREGIGLSFLDAMKLGLIPVGLNHATFNEYVVDGINGFVVNKTQRIDLPDLEKIAERMKRYFVKGRANYLRRLNALDEFIAKPIDAPVRPESGVRRIAAKIQRVLTKSPKRDSATRPRLKHGNPLVSVVIRVNGDADRFLRSHLSVCRQNYQEFEYVLIPSDSSAEMEEVLKPARTSFDLCFAETSIAPGQWMRNATLASRGRFMLFMEAGEEFADSYSLGDALEGVPSEADLLYSHHYRVDRDGNCDLRRAPDVEKLADNLRSGKRTQGWLEEMPCLCAMLVRRELFLRLQSEVSGPALLLKAYAEGNDCHHTNTAISIHHTAASDRPVPDEESEKCLITILLSPRLSSSD